MNIDFSAIMVIATFLTGIIWVYDSLFLAPKRKTSDAEVIKTKGGVEIEAIKEPLIVEYSKAFFPVILAVLLLRSFLVEPFRIPSGSMMPTLLTGDFILVNKFT